MTTKSKVFSLGGGNSDTKSVIASMKKQKGPVKKLQVNINEDLHRQFKSACVAKNVDMTEVVEAAILAWLKGEQNDF
ncbi:hypothetical protein BTN33_22720 [Aeromonas veronii]|uniref:plasmid partition protein ParG n=1 Tax=Aeromonas veronii TaxID=654 RepID=UPI000946C894|nr:plasmid partition protein ParG [Aeromonas veronii]OLF56803.1 hypothetical protein BTN33_22720 [Aeromonas veronii]